MRAYATRRERETQVAMTPMIDVVFLLLVFFVCTASFQILEALLPTDVAVTGSGVPSAAQPPPEVAEVVVTLSMQGGALVRSVDGRVFATAEDFRQVLTALASQASDLPIIIDPDRDVYLGDAIEVYDLCRAVGFDTIEFAAVAPK